MWHVDLPAQTSGSRLLRSFAACLASVLELSPNQVPHHDDDLGTAVSRWRTLLAGRGLGLVPVAGAARFQWPGYWIAVLGSVSGAERKAVLMFGTPPAVVLSPQDDVLLGKPAADLPVEEGYVAAALDPALGEASAATLQRGRVEMVAIADSAEAAMRRVTAVRAIPGGGAWRETVTALGAAYSALVAAAARGTN